MVHNNYEVLSEQNLFLLQYREYWFEKPESYLKPQSNNVTEGREGEEETKKRIEKKNNNTEHFKLNYHLKKTATREYFRRTAILVRFT